MSIATELTLLANSKQAIKNSINQKGGSITDSTPFADYSTAIDNLPSGGGNKLLTSIDVSDFSGTTMSDGRSYITDVIIPSGVTTLNGTFNFFTTITSVNIPNTVTTIGNSAFNNCTNLTNITIPSSVTSIGQNAFNSCQLFTNITIPSSVTSIGSQAFYSCIRLTYIICLATTPPTLGSNSFAGSYPIYVPSASVDTYKAASGWSSYASRIYPITQLATVDGNPVYNYDLGMTSSTTMITSTNMQKMPAGTSLELAEGIVDAGGSFGNYTSITLPSTFSSFDDQGMIGNTTTTLTCLATTPPTAERNDIGGANLTAIYVPAANVADYQADAAWSSFSSIIQAIPTE